MASSQPKISSKFQTKKSAAHFKECQKLEEKSCPGKFWYIFSAFTWLRVQKFHCRELNEYVYSCKFAYNYSPLPPKFALGCISCPMRMRIKCLPPISLRRDRRKTICLSTRAAASGSATTDRDVATDARAATCRRAAASGSATTDGGAATGRGAVAGHGRFRFAQNRFCKTMSFNL